MARKCRKACGVAGNGHEPEEWGTMLMEAKRPNGQARRSVIGALRGVGCLPALARKAEYKVGRLALISGATIWQLEWFFRLETGMKPHEWLFRLRQLDGLFLIGQGWGYGTVAAWLHYKRACHLWRDFKRVYEVTPCEARELGLSAWAVLERRPLVLFGPGDVPLASSNFGNGGENAEGADVSGLGIYGGFGVRPGMASSSNFGNKES
jgi:AraC-like DNA-binding protein